ncbi:MAG: acetyl-CoA carboxylase biotin carboxylase subunit, partial [Chitinophagales bacterium]
MIQKILIANRGEIALRIAKTCRKIGVETLAVYSDADAKMPFVKYCDEAVALGGNQLPETYLNGKKLIEIAQKFNCDAIHPGYGFLSENAGFAKACKKAKIIFIGPQADVIDEMGDKKKARLIAQKANVPVVPGYDGKEQDAKKLKSEAKKIGFPVLLKASAGGGGKGMRIVHEEKNLEKELAAAKSEAKNAFGDDKILLEKYFEKVRHIEVQILGDQHKNIIHLNERDCSVQRRYQKIIEESPSPALDEKSRNAICNASLKLAKQLNYQNAGTVEFIFDEKGGFYFLEVNTRLQVEHPVTEAITGLDLVEWQIRIAEGQKLELKQSDIGLIGHALECRIYAENPYKDFAPATGKILAFEFPEMEGLRLDNGVRAGNKIDVFYDPMIAKVVTHGKDRTEAIRKMHYALANAQIVGPENNQYFLQKIMQHKAFVAGDIYTHFLQDNKELFAPAENQLLQNLGLLSAAAYRWNYRKVRRTKFSGVKSGWRNVKYSLQKEAFKLNEKEVEIAYEVRKNGFY